MADKPRAVGDEEPEEGEIQDDEDDLLEDVSSAEEVPSPVQELKGRDVLPGHKYKPRNMTKDCLPRHSVRKSCKHKSQLMPSCTGDTKGKLNVTKYRNECNIPSREVRHVRLNSFVQTDSERDKCLEYKNMIVEYKPQGPKPLQDEDVVHEKENRHGCRDTAKVRKENRRRRHCSLQTSDKKSSSDSESDVEKKKKKQANDSVKRKQEAPKKSETKNKNCHRKKSQSPKRTKHHAIKKKACKKCSTKKVLKFSGQKRTNEITFKGDTSLLRRLRTMMAIHFPNEKADVVFDTNKDTGVVEQVVKDIVNATCDGLEKHHTSNISAGSEEVASSDSTKEIEILETVEKKAPEVITIDDTDSSEEPSKETSNEPHTPCLNPGNSEKTENISTETKVLNDEDEDLLQLRMLALQSSRRKETRKPNKEEDEILQLRLEALRSAVLKRYKDRKQRAQVLKFKQCSSKLTTLEQQNKKVDLEDDFQFSPSRFSPPVPVLAEAEPDETTTIVDMDLSNTDDEKEPETTQSVVPDEFCKQIPLPEETSNKPHLGSKEDPVQSPSCKTTSVKHSNEPLQPVWKHAPLSLPLPPPPPPPPPQPSSLQPPLTFAETEVNFSYNSCQVPETYNSNMMTYSVAPTQYQCQTYNEFYVNNSGLPTTDLDGAPLDPLPGTYDMHTMPAGAYVSPISCSSNSHCFAPAVPSSAEVSLPYIERNIVNTNVVSSQENKMTRCVVKNVIVENIKATENLYPNSVASYETTFLQPYPSVGTENVTHSSAVTTDKAMSQPSAQIFAVSESTNKPSQENAEEDEEFLRALLLTSLAAKKKRGSDSVISAKTQPDVGPSQKNVYPVENNLVGKSTTSEMSMLSVGSKNIKMSVNRIAKSSVPSESVITVANEPKMLHGQSQYNGQEITKKTHVKRASGPTIRQQVLVKNTLKLNKFSSLNKSITPSSGNKLANTPKPWKKTLRKTVSPLNLKQWTKLNKKNINLVANFSQSRTFTIKQPSSSMQSSNIRNLIAKNCSTGIRFGANRNNALTSLKVTVPAKASDKAHTRTVAESERDSGPSDSRFVIRLGEDSDSGDENDKNTLVAPVSKRRCVLKSGCPVLTLSTKNMPPISDVRVQQSSLTASTKPKSSQLPGSAPSSDFERSVDIFLKQARLSQESRTIPGTGGTSQEKTSEKQGSVSVTPLAVRHLPSSQQEEYRRLKQQIAELEEQRRQRLKQQNLLKMNVQKSNSPCSPNRVVTENSSEKSFKIVISNTVPEKKQLLQTAQKPQKMQVFVPKPVESKVLTVNSTTETPMQSKTLPLQNSSVLQKVREIMQKKKEPTKTTNTDESFLKETKSKITDSEACKELQSRPQSSPKTSDNLNVYEVRIFPECNTNYEGSSKHSEIAGKKDKITEVHLETSEVSESATEDKLAKLADAELQLLSRRYALLDDLTDMSALLRQVAVERVIEEECIKEVERLQLELKRAEEKLSQQRNLISNMKTNMAESYQRVAKGRLECIKISKACLTLGIGTKGDKYKVPAGGAQLMNLKLQQVYAQTRELSKSKSDSDDIVCAEQELVLQEINDGNDLGDAETVESNVPKISQAESDITVPFTTSAELITNTQSAVVVLNTTSECNVKENTSAIVDPSKNSTDCSFKDIKRISTGGAHDHDMDWYEPALGRENHEDRLRLPSTLVEYRSPLEHLKFNRGESGFGEKTVDPHAILCPFELMGSCQDDECSYQHQGR